MVKKAKPVHFGPETSELRQFIEDDPDYFLTDHFRKQIAERGIDYSDVLKVLSRGEVVSYEPDPKGRWRHTVKGRNVDGEEIHVVLRLDHERKKIVFVTAWKR